MCFNKWNLEGDVPPSNKTTSETGYISHTMQIIIGNLSLNGVTFDTLGSYFGYSSNTTQVGITTQPKSPVTYLMDSDNMFEFS